MNVSVLTSSTLYRKGATPPVRRRTRNQYKRQKLLQQKIAGGLVLLLSIVAVIITAGSPNFIDHDYTALLFVIPLGIYLLLTKRVIFE